jgi:outer membrane receptor protein involved in Fe transport
VLTHSPRRRWLSASCLAPLALSLFGGVALADPSPSPAPAAADELPTKPTPRAGAAQSAEVVVTASRVNLLGRAETASQGVITRKEVELRPIQRIGQLYETVPGLVVTIHSGEGKANQYLLRGFNLDHGTDFATFVDSMPVNRPTNTHGQGYADQNFLMPQIVGGIDYTKGPYYAAIGDFGAVGSAHVRLLDELPNEVAGSVNTFGDEEVYVGGTRHLGPDDRAWAAVDVAHVDGPWDPPGDFRKVLAAARYSHGSDVEGFSLTGMYYQSLGRLITDQPLRAFQEGLIGRYGTLDPTDMSKSQRFSLSGHYGRTGEDWKLSLDAYAIKSSMTLWNNFTHFLDDPVNGDQEEQNESRTTLGGDGAFTKALRVGPIPTDTTVGFQLRYDDAYVDKKHTLMRTPLDYCSVEQDDGPAIQVPAVNFNCQADRAHIVDFGPYIENTAHWTSWLRTVVGLREEYYQASDRSEVTGSSGSAHQFLFQPKGSIVLGPWRSTELYFSAGRGFHSDDIRGVIGSVPGQGIPGSAATPLLASATGEEIGLRTNIIPRLSIQVSVFNEDFKSEQRYNADIGQDSPFAPSRRQGVEVSAQYRPFPFIELNTDLTFSKARYRGTPAEFAAFGLDGPWIANAPAFIGSFGVLVDNLGPWFGGLQWRRLGPYPISNGDQFPQDKGYSEFNLDVGYKVNDGLKLQVGIYNLLNEKANASAYYYTGRLPGEPVEGITDYQVHPVEPIAARFTLTKAF